MLNYFLKLLLFYHVKKKLCQTFQSGDWFWSYFNLSQNVKKNYQCVMQLAFFWILYSIICCYPTEFVRFKNIQELFSTCQSRESQRISNHHPIFSMSTNSIFFVVVDMKNSNFSGISVWKFLMYQIIETTKNERILNCWNLPNLPVLIFVPNFLF